MMGPDNQNIGDTFVIENWQLRYMKFKHFVGPRVWRKMKIAIILGVLWFAVDISFVFVIQAFLFCLKVIDVQQLSIKSITQLSSEQAILILFIFGVLRAVVSALKGYVTMMSTEDLASHLRKLVLFNALTDTKGQSTTAETLRLFNTNVSGTSSFVFALMSLSVVAITGSFYVLVGTYLSPLEFWIGILLFGFFVLPLKLLEAKQRKMSEIANHEANRTSDNLVQSLKNLFLLRLYRYESKVYAYGAESIKNYQQSFRIFFLILGIKSSFPMFVGTFVIGLLTYVGVNFFHTPGMQLISIFYIFLRLAQVFADGAGHFAQLKFYFPFVKEIYAKIEHDTDTSFNNQNLAKLDPVRTIDVQSLAFKYPEGNFLFRHLNLQLQQGDILLVQGRSGSGKSTLILNLVGVLTPTEGQVLINGENLPLAKKTVSDQIAHVGAEPFFIPGSVRNNLIYLNEHQDIADQKIWEALRHASADGFVHALPQGLDTVLSEQAQLSTGQKQRLSLARALLRDPHILILDEATANLDPQTENEIKKTIVQESQKRIVIIISHKEALHDIATKKIHLTMQDSSAANTGQTFNSKETVVS